MNPPGAAFLDELADLYRVDFAPQDVDAGTVPDDGDPIAEAEPCSVQRRSVTRDTSADATVQVTSYSVFFGREVDLRLDDLVAVGTKRLRVTGLLDGFEVTAEGRA